MSEPEPGKPRRRVLAEVPAASRYDRLRRLLLGGEIAELDAHDHRIAELERRAGELPERLPGALEAARDLHGTVRLAQALAPPFTHAFGHAVRANRQAIVDLLFPVIGPAIRKAVAEAVRNLAAGINTAVESSFTVRGLRWRLESWRSGVPYAQVALAHTLAYGIDHVFVIARDSGLVCFHAAAANLPSLDADAIAGMLTAVGDFVHDSVGGAEGGTLESAQVGEHVLWVLVGPKFNLACFLRGVPPPALREVLAERLEDIHRRDAERAETGLPPDDAAAPIWREWLDPMALVQAVPHAGDAPAVRTSHWPARVVLLFVLVALGVLAAWLWQRHRQLADLRQRLDAHPGFVLTGLERRGFDGVDVEGLLDPDAPPLGPDLAASGFAAHAPRVVTTGFVSTDDRMIVRRAQRLLAPPDGVSLSVTDGVLSATGSADREWIESVRERAPWVAGVRSVRFTVAPDVDPVAVARRELEGLIREVEGTTIRFRQDDSALPGQDGAVDGLAAKLQRIVALAPSAHERVTISTQGGHDAVGSAEANVVVKARRAQWLADALASRGVRAVADSGATAGDEREAVVRIRLQPGTE